MKTLVKRTKTPWLTDHLCWGSVDGRYTHDLLPMPYTFEAAEVTARKVREARDFLEVPIAVENVSSYAEFHVSEMTEWEFLNEVVERADCGILLDVNNIYVSSQQPQISIRYEYLNSVPAERVAQIHIAGHSKFEKYILDTHDHPVIDPGVEAVRARHSPRRARRPRCSEWDDRIPSFDEVHAEARKAEKYIAGASALRGVDDSRGIAKADGRGPDAPLARRRSTSIHRRRGEADTFQAERSADFARTPGDLQPQLLVSSARFALRGFPRPAAVLGQRAFDGCARAYLADRPSQSLTLRNLGSGLEEWLREHPEYAGEQFDLALDMMRLEWAHIEAFDGEERRRSVRKICSSWGRSLRIGLQPYIWLLELRYPVDDLRIDASQWIEEREEASNAPSNDRVERDLRCAARRYRRLKRRQIHLAVFRAANVVYYRRLDAGEFELLAALGAGKPVADALDLLMESDAVADEDAAALAVSVQNWFAEWARMGWLTGPRA